jgi:hypothetical protein
MDKDTVRKIGRALETGGLSLVFERGEVPPEPERTPPTTRLGRFAEVLATGGYSLLERHIEVEVPETAGSTQGPKATEQEN